MTPLAIRRQNDETVEICDINLQSPSYCLASTSSKHDFYDINVTPSIPRSGKTPYAGWFRNPIDATILRVCKVLHQEGLPLLYGENQFVFDLDNTSVYGFNPLPIPVKIDGGRMLRKSRGILDLGDLHTDKTQDSIKNMFNVLHAWDLPGWMFGDPYVIPLTI